jgi:DNA sulfur modification protein DndC
MTNSTAAISFLDIEDHVRDTRRSIVENYQADSRPWIVAYSGGKDSTLVLQLVYEMLCSLGERAAKPVHVIASDTMVEAPQIAEYVGHSLRAIAADAQARGFDLTTHLVQPRPADGFWGNLIGKGYPPPTRWFRWCTSKMKIKPVRTLISDLVKDHGSAILLLGTRMTESANRMQRMQGRQYTERGLNPHHELANTLVFSPISNWTTDQVWDYLFENNPPPWKASHDFMLELYRRANGGECPVVVDKDTPSCGGSRFGCWTCTVVKEDKSIQGFIETGETWLEPLNAFRNWLKEIREDESLRSKYRRDGRPGLGPFNSDARMRIFDELLRLEAKVGIPLISDEDIRYIQQEWAREFDVRHSALRIAKSNGRIVRASA